MRILAIETSCDETAVSILDATGGADAPQVKVLAQVVLSQLALHASWGGVVPNLAAREHERSLTPVLRTALTEAGLLATRTVPTEIPPETAAILVREQELAQTLLPFLADIERPALDLIAVTTGPGLEPALWVGINTAKALAVAWDLPLIATNHMAGHLYAGLAEGKPLALPAIALLVSGGHTELVLVRADGTREVLGTTRDDAAGEAFDKIARLLGLPYPGGPAIARLAAEPTGYTLPARLPRPMIGSADYDFSFSGLKTAVLYLVRDLGNLTDDMRRAVAREFEEAVVEVLLAKSSRAIEEHQPRTFVIGGGVSANRHLRERAAALIATRFPDVTLSIPSATLSTDNATMVGVAGYLEFLQSGASNPTEIRAQGNLTL